MQRKGGFALLRAYRNRLRGKCILNLVTPEAVEPMEGVRVWADFHPGDPRLVEMLYRSSVFALPSEIDKSPYSVLEGMFAGLPVVSTDVGGIPEMVVDGETGFLVPPGDTQAIAERLEVLARDPALRGSMGETGRERVLRRYSVDRLVGDVDALYRELLSSSSSITRR